MVFQRNYKAWYGEELNVPRWNDIIDKYDLITDKKREKERKVSGFERDKGRKRRASAAVGRL